MKETTTPAILSDLVPDDSSLYENIDLTGLAAFALPTLHQRHISTTFENIVVTAYRLFPTKFSLEGYPEYPDAARVEGWKEFHRDLIKSVRAQFEEFKD